eukprot:scaffold11230_cov22-Tisochrysis_lutea.AAC.2
MIVRARACVPLLGRMIVRARACVPLLGHMIVRVRAGGPATGQAHLPPACCSACRADANAGDSEACRPVYKKVNVKVSHVGQPLAKLPTCHPCAGVPELCWPTLTNVSLLTNMSI